MGTSNVNSKPRWNWLKTAAIFALVSIAGPLSVVAQDGAVPSEAEQARLQNRWRQELRTGIDNALDLSSAERQRMHENLQACLALNLSQGDLELIFPTSEEQPQIQVRTQLRLQNRIRAAAEDDLPVEPILAKVHEGCMKGAQGDRLERVAERVENHLRTASGVMTRAMSEGLSAPDEPVQQRRMVREMAQNMWRGLSENDLNQLREQARLRAQERDCSLQDLNSAAEIASDLAEDGADRNQALQLAGEALRQGYTGEEMRQLRFMVMTGNRRGGPIDDMVEEMRHCLGEGMGAGEMHQHMVQGGWMGPGDMSSPGGHRPIDNMGGGGPGDGHESGQTGGHGGQDGNSGSGDAGGNQGTGGQGGGGGR